MLTIKKASLLCLASCISYYQIQGNFKQASNFKDLLLYFQLKANCKNLKQHKTIEDKLGHKIIFLWKIKCLNNKFDKKLKHCKIKCMDNRVNKALKDYKIRYTSNGVDKKLKNGKMKLYFSLVFTKVGSRISDLTPRSYAFYD